jgi:hypothetical protein
MKTNLTELRESLEEAFSGEAYNGTIVSVNVNDKKAEAEGELGVASVTITITTNDDKRVSGTIFIVEKEKSVVTVFANNSNAHDVIFTNTSLDSVSKSQKYVEQFFERSTRRMLNASTDIANDSSSPKKNYKNKTHGKSSNKKDNYRHTENA